jgi:hypothetical protein
VKFTKIKKWKFYETWFHKNRKTGLISYIFCDPHGNYYFHITCFKKCCGMEYCIKDNINNYCEHIVYYSSLQHGLRYTSFEECREAVIEWHKTWG